MDKPDTGSDFFMLIGLTLTLVFLLRREIVAEWRELDEKRNTWRIYGPLKRPFNPKPLDDWARKQRK